MSRANARRFIKSESEHKRQVRTLKKKKKKKKKEKKRKFGGQSQNTAGLPPSTVIVLGTLYCYIIGY
jgi:hypothetical protein